MDRKSAKQLLPVITAYAEGKSIQYYSKLEKRWVDTGDAVDFSDPPDQYRIKPSPREFFRFEYPDGIWGITCFPTEEAAQEYATKNYPNGQYRIVKFVEQMPV